MLMNHKLLRYKLIFMLILILPFYAKGQELNKSILKANDQFKNFAFKDAQNTYLKLLKKGQKPSYEIYSNLGDTYYYNSDYSSALDWYLKAFNEFNDKLTFENYYKLIVCLKSNEEFELLKAVIENATKKYPDKAKAFNDLYFENYIETIERQSNRVGDVEKLKINSNSIDFGLIYMPDNEFYKSKIEESLKSTQIKKRKQELNVIKRKIADGVIKDSTRLKKTQKLNEIKDIASENLPEYKYILFTSSRDSLSDKKRHNWNKKPYFKIYASKINPDSTFSKPFKLKGEVNYDFHTSSPVVTNDGLTMYFTRLVEYKDNYNASKTDNDKIGNLKIFQADLIDGSWENVRELPPPINLPSSSSAHPALSPDNSELYFVSNRNNTIENSDIYVVKRNKKGGFENTANKLNTDINTIGRESFPFIDQEGVLYFASDGHPGFGGLDIFAAVKDNKGKYFVENVGKPINSNFDDYSYSYNTKSKIGFFTTNRDGKKEVDNIYRFKELKKINFPLKQEAIVFGITKDSLSGIPLSNVKIELLDMSNKVISTFESGLDGLYKISVEPSTPYTLRFSKPSYSIQTKKIKSLNVLEEFEYNVGLLNELQVVVDNKVVQLKEGDDLSNSLKLNPIYFDYGGYSIRKSSKIELDKVVTLLKTRPSISIIIRSHTDSRGKDEYNLSLSKNRAKSTIDYIVNEGGIPSDRVTGDGYGETELLNNCKNGVNCSEKEHELNRRSEFIIKINK